MIPTTPAFDHDIKTRVQQHHGFQAAQRPCLKTINVAVMWRLPQAHLFHAFSLSAPLKGHEAALSTAAARALIRLPHSHTALPGGAFQERGKF